MRHYSIAIVTTLACAGAFAQAPVIFEVLNAGAYTAPLAPGSVFVVKGSNLCGVSTVATPPYRTAALGGASIRLTLLLDGSTLDAYMIYCFNAGGTTQLAGEIPNSAAPGSYDLTVMTNNGASSVSFLGSAVSVGVHTFGIITQAGNGSGRALAQNVVSPTRYDLNGFTTGAVVGASFSRSPAKPSQFVILWGTGLGAAPGYDANAPTGGLDFITTQNLDVKVIVGGTEITPIYAGRSNVFPGLDNVIFQLPPDITTGCILTLQVRAAGWLSNFSTISIAPDPSADTCVDPQYSPGILSKLDRGGTVAGGFFELTGYNTTALALGAFSLYTADNISKPLHVAPASSGACQVYKGTGRFVDEVLGATDAVLDAGAITLNGPNVSNAAFEHPFNQLSGEIQKAYFLPFPIATAGGSALPPVITPGTYTLTGIGGADVGPFTASMTIPEPVSLTADLPVTVNRSQDLTLAWTGGGNSVVVITGTSEMHQENISFYDFGTFICTTTADQLAYTVPASILLQLPSSSVLGFHFYSISSLSVFTTSVPASGNGLFSAPLKAGGTIDVGIFVAGIGSTSSPIYY